MGVNNFRQSGEIPFLKKMIKGKKNPVLLDVGANVGEWSREAFKINPTSTIYAFEPNPRSFKQLSTIPCLKAYPFAIGSEAGQTKLYLRKDQPTSPLASLNKEAIIRLNREVEEIEVPVMTLDDFIDQEKLQEIHLLKIDVEGYEYEVLKGCQQSIQTGIIQTIQFEFNEMNVFTRTFFRDFQKLLSNFKFYRLLPNDMIPIRNYDSYLTEIFAYQNIVAIR